MVAGDGRGEATEEALGFLVLLLASQLVLAVLVRGCRGLSRCCSGYGHMGSPGAGVEWLSISRRARGGLSPSHAAQTSKEKRLRALWLRLAGGDPRILVLQGRALLVDACFARSGRRQRIE